MPHSICFVDDDQNELKRFEKYLKEDFIIGIGTSPKKALESLNDKGISKPDLWVLDMYFPEGQETSDDGKRKINEEWQKFLKSRNEFQQILVKYGQSSHGGLELAKKLKDKYNQSNFLFFTRKGMIDDAIRGLKAEAMQIMKKPDYNEDDFKNANENPIRATDLAFKKKSDDIANDILESINKLGFGFRYKKLIIGLVIGFVVGFFASLTSNLVWSTLFE